MEIEEDGMAVERHGARPVRGVDALGAVDGVLDALDAEVEGLDDGGVGQGAQQAPGRTSLKVHRD